MKPTPASESACPLQWPAGVPRTLTAKRRKGQFAVAFGAARSGMLNELERLGGRDFILSSNLPSRPDGLPYADGCLVSPDPGAAIYFTRNGARLCVACDTYETVAANIRGIGLSVEALRSLERHGSSHMVDAAFLGFRSLPAARPWWDVLGVPATATREQARDAFKERARTCHPDVVGGSSPAWESIDAAWQQFERLAAS